MEIGILIVILVLILGPGRAGSLAGRIFGTVRKVDDAKRGLTNPMTWLTRLTGTDKPSGKPPADEK